MASTTAWDSLGRRDVLIGASLTRAWNERIGKTVKRSKDYPNPEYYSLRYNFKPESIDDENPGTLTPKPGSEGQGRFYELERPSQQPGESHRFTAEQQPSKEWECVLLWDPILQQLTLEKLESTLNLTHEGRTSTKGRPPSSTPPSLPGSSRDKRGVKSTSAGRSSTSSPMASARELAEDLERALIASADADAEGEPDEELEFQAALDAAAESMKQEEEEDEEEMEAVVVAAPPPPPPPVQVKPSQKAKPTGRGRTRSNAKRDRDDDIEEEVLAFGEPSRPMKRTRGSSTNGATNPALEQPAPSQTHAVPTPSQLLQPPSRITYAGSESSDDSDDGGQDLDAAALELEQTLAEAADEADEDEGMEAVLSEYSRHDSGRPPSLNELLGAPSQNDDYSSSDDSDDD